MSIPTGAPECHPVDSRSAADRATFAAASYVRSAAPRIPASATEPLSSRGQAALGRLVDTLKAGA